MIYIIQRQFVKALDAMSTKVKSGTYCVPEHFHCKIRKDECLPHVRFRLPFAGFIQGPLNYKHRHDLVQHLYHHKEENEDPKHLVL